MKTVTVSVYEIIELNDKAIQTAIENHRDINVDHDWWQNVYEDFKSICEILGVETDDIEFAMFCQGSGASFTGTYQYKSDALDKIKEYAPNDEKLHAIADALHACGECSATINRQAHHSSHENSVTIYVYDKDGDYAENETQDAVIDALRNLMRWLFKSLEEDYEYLTSDEAVVDTIDANAYTFTENGERF